MASFPDVMLKVSGDPYFGRSYCMLRLSVSYRCSMLLICWRLPSCSVLSLNVEVFGFFFQWEGTLVWSFSFGFGSPLEGFLYGHTDLEEIMLNKAMICPLGDYVVNGKGLLE